MSSMSPNNTSDVAKEGGKLEAFTPGAYLYTFIEYMYVLCRHVARILVREVTLGGDKTRVG